MSIGIKWDGIIPNLSEKFMNVIHIVYFKGGGHNPPTGWENTCSPLITQHVPVILNDLESVVIREG